MRVPDLLGTVTMRTRGVVGFWVRGVDGSLVDGYTNCGLAVVVVGVVGALVVVVVLEVVPSVMIVTIVGLRVAMGGGGLRLGDGDSKTGFGPLVAGTGFRFEPSTIGRSDRLTEGLAVGVEGTG